MWEVAARADVSEMFETMMRYENASYEATEQYRSAKHAWTSLRSKWHAAREQTMTDSEEHTAHADLQAPMVVSSLAGQRPPLEFWWSLRLRHMMHMWLQWTREYHPELELSSSDSESEDEIEPPPVWEWWVHVT